MLAVRGDDAKTRFERDASAARRRGTRARGEGGRRGARDGSFREVPRVERDAATTRDGDETREEAREEARATLGETRETRGDARAKGERED